MKSMQWSVPPTKSGDKTAREKPYVGRAILLKSLPCVSWWR
jgi:hypothetical protein